MNAIKINSFSLKFVFLGIDHCYYVTYLNKAFSRKYHENTLFRTTICDFNSHKFFGKKFSLVGGGLNLFYHAKLKYIHI